MKSIIFNQHQVNYALKNKEGIFRVVVKNKLLKSCYKVGSHDYFTGKSESELAVCDHTWAGKRIGMSCIDCDKEIISKAPYQAGQEIFVKEVWGIGSRPDRYGGYEGFEYKADEILIDEIESLPCYPIDYDELPENIEIDDWIGNWQQARFMPQWASRLTLRIKGVRVEKLVNIDINDLEKEGLPEKYDATCPSSWFAKLWNSTHKKPEEKWEANPFVFCFNYEVA